LDSATPEDVQFVKKNSRHAAAAGKFVAFQREAFDLAVRSRSGETAFYPLVENPSPGRDFAPFDAPAPNEFRCATGGRAAAQRVMQELNYVGVSGDNEFFECNGELVANEMAPRVHNSGHWSIEGAATQLRSLEAVVGLPLGSTATTESPRC